MISEVAGILKPRAGHSPGGPVVKNPPCSAGRSGSIPGQGTKSQHAMGELSPRATTREPVCQNRRCHLLQLRPNAAKYINNKK